MKLSEILILATLPTFGPPKVELQPIDIARFQIPAVEAPSKIVKTIVCHKEVVGPLIAALDCVMQAEQATKKRLLKNYGGCYVPRRIRDNPDVWSSHAYGRAIDLNVPPGGSRSVNLQHPAVVKCFKAQGFYWGGDWTNPDYMHFEYPSII